MRRLSLASGVWEWNAGKSNVSIRTPYGKRVVIDYPKFTGLSWAEIENLQENKGLSITSGVVRKYIEENLILVESKK